MVTFWSRTDRTNKGQEGMIHSKQAVRHTQNKRYSASITQSGTLSNRLLISRLQVRFLCGSPALHLPDVAAPTLPVPPFRISHFTGLSGPIQPGNPGVNPRMPRIGQNPQPNLKVTLTINAGSKVAFCVRLEYNFQQGSYQVKEHYRDLC